MTESTGADARKRSRGGGRPPRISREQILTTAATIPLEELSLTGLAAALGVTHSALYRYFPSRAALLAALGAAAANRLHVPDPRGRTWQEWLVDAAFGYRGLLIDRVHLADLKSTGMAATSIPLFETAFGVLTAAGFTLEETADAWRLFNSCCLGGAITARRQEHPDTRDTEVFRTLFDDFGTPPDAPVRAMIGIWSTVDYDTAFRREIETVIAGMAHRLATHERP